MDKWIVLLLFDYLIPQGLTCSGNGFPTEWTQAASGVTMVTDWFITETIKRQFTFNYTMTDFYTATGLKYGQAPYCEDEYYDQITGYHYYLMLYTEQNIYNTDPSNRQICHAFKLYNSVIREYYVDLGGPRVLSSASACTSHFISATKSIALTKYNYQHVNCPFSFETYNYTFSSDGNPDHCSNSRSVARITNNNIVLKSCYDLNLVNKANPFYGTFNCLGNWPAENRDKASFGDFIVLEMYDNSPWPYCGRYKVAIDGVITLSLYLSVSEGAWFPVYCDASKDNEYYDQSGTSQYVRMQFTPVVPWTTSTNSTIITTINDSITEKAGTASFPFNITMGTHLTDVLVIHVKTTEDAIAKVTNNVTAMTHKETEVSVTSVVPSTFTDIDSSRGKGFWGMMENLHWAWWILVIAVISLLLSLIICLIVCTVKRNKK